MTNTLNKFIKIGRIYWIKPMPIPGMHSKVRPAIAISKYDSGKTIFIQIGSSNSKIPSSVIATELFKKTIEKHDTELHKSHLHVDISKPEWNTSVLKPYLIKGKYVNVDYEILKMIRHIYFTRRKELNGTRIRKAKVESILNNIKNAEKQLIMLKQSEPIKFKKMNVKKLIEKFKKI